MKHTHKSLQKGKGKFVETEHQRHIQFKAYLIKRNICTEFVTHYNLTSEDIMMFFQRKKVALHMLNIVRIKTSIVSIFELICGKNISPGKIL